MNNLRIEVTPDDFEKIDDDSKKLVVIYKALVVQQKHCENTCEDNNKKFKKLFRRRKIDTSIAAGSGFAGGFFAVLVKNITGLFK